MVLLFLFQSVHKSASCKHNLLHFSEETFDAIFSAKGRSSNKLNRIKTLKNKIKKGLMILFML